MDTLNTLLGNVEKQKSADRNTASDWEKIKKRIDTDKRRQLLWQFARNAAAVLLPVFLMWQYIITPSLNNDENLFAEVASSPTGISKVTLPDGSVVWLNVSSKLTYPQQFTKKERTVKLEGEGYFSVKSDKSQRFNVELASGLKVSAYGTEFNITAYPQTETSRVLLTKGEIDVSVSGKEGKTIPNKGEEVLVSAKTGKMEIKPADVYLQTAWRDGKIVFHHEELRSIAEKMASRFSVEFYFANKETGNHQFTGTFTTESVTEILDLLKQSAPIDYDVVYIGNESGTVSPKRIITIKPR